MPSNQSPEYLESGAVYTSKEFRARLRIGEAGWRQLKRQGLKVYRIGKTCLVRTEDFHEFLQSQVQKE